MQQPTVSQVFNQVLDPPLWVVTAARGADRGGLIATFVSNASIVPELSRVLVGIGRRHHTWSLVEATHCFGLHLFDETRVDWIARFGLQSGRQADKFAGVESSVGVTGVPLLPGALTWLECRVEATLETGDRSVYLAEVVQVGPLQVGQPLTLQRMASLLSPEQKQALREDLLRDADLDADAIRAWRRSHAREAK